MCKYRQNYFAVIDAQVGITNGGKLAMSPQMGRLHRNHNIIFSDVTITSSSSEYVIVNLHGLRKQTLLK